jgi:LuxR family maltose regulon positive regulatory protein
LTLPSDSTRLPLIKTKLSAPQPPTGLLKRTHLLSLLEEGSRAKLTLICAPPGYGKTTLTAEWIAALENAPGGSKAQVGWLALDESDNDPTVFLSYLTAAMQSIHPQLAETVIATISAFPPPPFQTVLSVLINDLLEQKYELVLVLDDYHTISNPAIHEGLAFLLDHLPANAHLVIATRSDPPFPLARLRARSELVEIRAKDLRFSPAETSSLLNERMELGLDEEDLSRLEERTEGWVAGLKMAALALKGQPDASLFVKTFSGSHRYILDYLVEEVLRRQPEDMQSFLLQTSILENLNGPLCDAVTELQPGGGSRSGQQILDELERANLFLVPLDAERRWYRYHHLFADLLKARLNQAQPDMAARLHLRASAWFAQNGYITEAIQHLFAAGETEQAAELIERYAPARWAAGELSIARMVENLPAEMLIARPKLGLYRAWQLIGQGHAARAVPLLNDLAHHLSSADPASGARWMQTIVALVLAYLTPPSAAPGSDPLPDDRLLDEIPDEELVLRDAADVLYGMLLGRRGEIDRAADVLARCVQREKSSRGTLAIPSSVSLLTRIRLIQGRLHAAASLCHEFLDTIQEKSVRLIYAAGGMKIALGEVLYEWNDLEEAEKQIREGLQASEAWDNLSIDAFGYLGLARVLQARGDHSGAIQVSEKLEERLKGRARPPEIADELVTLKIRLQLAAGDLNNAAAWADQVHLNEPFDLRQEHYRLTLARIRLAQKRYAEAENLLAGMASIAAEGQRHTRRLKYDLLLAVALSGGQRVSEAMGLIETCLSLAEPEGYVRLFLDSGEPVYELLNQYLRREPAPAHKAYAQMLVDAFLISAHNLPKRASPGALAESLTARELEVLHLMALGCSNRQIAENLVISEGTVKFYVHAVLEKLGVHSRTQAIVKAKELQLI